MKMETHVHTSEVSRCGKVAAEDMVRMYFEAGYGAMVFTDHLFNDWRPEIARTDRPDAWLEGYRAAKRAGEKMGVAVLLGAEIRLDRVGNEDFLTYGLRESDIGWLMDTLDGAETFEQVSKAVRGRGLFLVQAHPFRKGLRPQPAELLDGMEVYNGNPRHDSHNRLAHGCALRGRLRMFSGSDAHQPQDVGRGGMIVPGEIRDNASWLTFVRSAGLEWDREYAKRAVETWDV